MLKRLALCAFVALSLAMLAAPALMGCGPKAGTKEGARQVAPPETEMLKTEVKDEGDIPANAG